MVDSDIQKPPESDTLTDYDMKRLSLYIRLLDADANRVEWRTSAKSLFEIDPAGDEDRAHRMYESHLARARWMTEHGYRHLLAKGRP